jgi:hypothetical protein
MKKLLLAATLALAPVAASVATLDGSRLTCKDLAMAYVDAKSPYSANGSAKQGAERPFHVAIMSHGFSGGFCKPLELLVFACERCDMKSTDIRR